MTSLPQFSHTLIEKMMTYALGRGSELRPANRMISNETGSRRLPFQTLIQQIVESLPFQSRRGGGCRSMMISREKLAWTNVPKGMGTAGAAIP